MKSITASVITIILMVFSNTAFADYCTGKGERCWKNAAETNVFHMNKMYNRIMANDLTDEYKTWLKDSQTTWSSKVESQCQTNQCVAKSVEERTQWLTAKWIDIKKAGGK